MMKNVSVKNIIMGIVGIVVVGFGAGMLVKTGYGADTLNGFFTGITRILPITLGQMNTIFNASMIVLIYLVDRKKVGIGMILSVFLLQFPIDLAMKLYPSSPNIYLGFVSDVLSLYVFSFGAALMIESDLGSTVYDALTILAAEKLKKPFKPVRYACDGFCLLMAFIFHGEIGMGTVLSFLAMGTFIVFNRNIVCKVLKIKK